MSISNACIDFKEIFFSQTQDVVFEVFTLYCQTMLAENDDQGFYKNKNETDREYKKRVSNWTYEDFDAFAETFNDVFNDFGLNVLLTRSGLIPKQEQKIIDDIYTPVTRYLSDSKWHEVNDHFIHAFAAYSKKEYSVSITSAISAIQAYLQILVNNKVGSGNIKFLISKAQEKN